MIHRLTLLPAAAAIFIACSAPAANRTNASSAAEPAARSGTGMMMGRHMMGGGMMGGDMMRGGMTGGSMADMRTIHALLSSHGKIERSVDNIPGGVRTVTRSGDPQVAEMIRTHVRQMRDRYERDQPIRAMDPLFRELFGNRDKAKLEIRDIPGGVEVVHTSSDPQVVELIRQHAHHFVNSVVDRGMAAAMGPTPLPDAHRGQ